jgi:hypothetical protein
MVFRDALMLQTLRMMLRSLLLLPSMGFDGVGAVAPACDPRVKRTHIAFKEIIVDSASHPVAIIAIKLVGLAA